MSRSYFTPQAGRAHKAGASEGEVPWGVSSTNAQFRAYEPAEMRNSRSDPAQVKPCLDPAQSIVGAPRRSGLAAKSSAGSGKRGMSDAGSAKTVRSSDQGQQPVQAHGSGGRPSWSNVHQQPIPHRNFVATTSNQEREASALEARQRHFPYRDEFAPRSKRLLYEMALERCSRDSVKSASSMADDLSCFTLPSTAAGSVAASGARSASTPSLARVPTGDSQRLSCNIAKRRRELWLKAPNQCEWDAAWLRNVHANEGPCGLVGANYSGRYHEDTLQRQGERIISVNALLPDGRVDTEARGKS